jgi:energy-coupling factor transporter ATP-binding protein EcfA2
LSSPRFNINLVRELTLGNFKCFSTTQKFPFRPITLLYGPNGSGKSSVIQALNWLPALANGTWHQNYGRFVRNHDQESDLTLGAKISLAEEVLKPDESKPFISRLRNLIASKVETFNFEAQLTGKDPVSIFSDEGLASSFQHWTEVPLISRITVSVNDARFLELQHQFGRPGVTTAFFQQRSRLKIVQFNVEHPIVPFLLAISKELALDRIQERIDNRSFLDELSRSQIDPLGQLLYRDFQNAVRDFELSTITSDELFGAISDKIFFDPRKLPIRADLNERDRDMYWVSIDDANHHELEVPFLDLLPKSQTDENEIREFILDHFRLSIILFSNFLSDLDELTLGFGSPFYEVLHLGALRSIPAGEFLLTDREAQREDAPDWHLPNGLDQIERQIKSVNAWLQSLARPDTAYKFLTSEVDIEERMEDAPSIKTKHLRFKGILDLQRNVAVALSETGTGFSQLLPIILAAFSGNGELVVIQQPELHLHPALQSELGDLFITRALGERSDESKWGGTNQFVLETHSEHLLLRIMRRIRETSRGTLPSDIPPVHADDVSILYIDNKDGETVVRTMPLSDDGQLLYDWPGGFFEEGLREVLI